MVTVITEKLRNQSLEDVKVEAVPSLQNASSPWTLKTSPTSAFHYKGSKGWKVFIDPKEPWPREPVPGTTAQTPLFSAGIPTKGGALGTQNLVTHSQGTMILPPCPSAEKFIESCAEMEAIPNTPPPPPMKRHCRSLSIPTVDKVDQCNKWQPQANQVWRPVTPRPHYSKLKNRNTPHTGPQRPITSRASPQLNTQVHGCLKPVSGVSSSSYVTGKWPVSKSQDFSTPPESPVPRPDSASSGNQPSFESAAHVSWSEDLKSVPDSPSPPDFSIDSGCSDNSHTKTNLDSFRLRSLSMEEPIAQLLKSGFSARNTCSMPVIPGSGTHHSTPSSPHRQRVPRCRSQPCELHDRKCLKRRRDEERPSLDFLKMTETAYDRGGWRLSSRYLPQHIRSSRSLASLFSEPPECVVGLKTIASSPLDAATIHSSLRAQQQSSLSATDNKRETRGSSSGCNRGIASPADQKKTTQGHQSVHKKEEGRESLSDKFIDTEDACSCDREKEIPYKESEEEVFELEMNDLDLDQIEND